MYYAGGYNGLTEAWIHRLKMNTPNAESFPEEPQQAINRPWEYNSLGTSLSSDMVRMILGDIEVDS